MMNSGSLLQRQDALLLFILDVRILGSPAFGLWDSHQCFPELSNLQHQTESYSVSSTDSEVFGLGMTMLPVSLVLRKLDSYPLILSIVKWQWLGKNKRLQVGMDTHVKKLMMLWTLGSKILINLLACRNGLSNPVVVVFTPTVVSIFHLSEGFNPTLPEKMVIGFQKVISKQNTIDYPEDSTLPNIFISRFRFRYPLPTGEFQYVTPTRMWITIQKNYSSFQFRQAEIWGDICSNG